MAHQETNSREELEYLIRARYALIYVVSSEEERVEGRCARSVPRAVAR